MYNIYIIQKYQGIYGDVMSELDIRTQIYLAKEQHEALKQKATEKSVSMAHLIREAVATYLVQLDKEETEVDSQTYLNDPIWQIPTIAQELGPSGFSDLAENHDEYLYGQVNDSSSK